MTAIMAFPSRPSEPSRSHSTPLPADLEPRQNEVPASSWTAVRTDDHRRDSSSDELHAPRPPHEERPWWKVSPIDKHGWLVLLAAYLGMPKE